MKNDITIINSEKKFFEINFFELLQFKNMIFFFTLRDLQTVYLQTILGPLWLILIPLISSSIYTLIFGVIANMPTDGIDQFIFLYRDNFFLFLALTFQEIPIYSTHMLI